MHDVPVFRTAFPFCTAILNSSLGLYFYAQLNYFFPFSVAGLAMYFLYGIRKSVHRCHDDQEVVLFDISARNQ